MRIWTSFKFTPGSEQPILFSVVAYFPNDYCRFFCSSDLSPEAPTSEEQTHVSNIFRCALHIYKDAPNISMMDENKPVGLSFGSVHDKWSVCFQYFPNRLKHSCKKFLHSPPIPPTSRGQTITLPEGLIASQILESDFETIRQTASIHYSDEYLLSLCHASVCVRVGNDGRPIAWGLKHSTNAIGALYVDPEFRKMGLARFVLNELVTTVQLNAILDALRPRWEFADVLEGNQQGLQFFGSLEGWEEEWRCHWLDFYSL